MADSNDHHPEPKDKPDPVQHVTSPDSRSRSESRHSTQSPVDKASPTKDGPTHSPPRKDRDERIKILQEKRKEEQQKKLDELRQAQLQAQKVREKQEEERRRKLEELKLRDENRRAAVEERRRRLLELEKEKREAFWKKASEREAKIESVKAHQRHSVYAFGSSTSRFLGWEPAHTSRRAASQNNLNRKPLEKPSEKRSSSACSYDRKTSGKLKAAISTPILSRRPFERIRDDSSPINATSNSFKRLSPNIVYPHRKKTDLVPTIPSSTRNSHLTSTLRMNSRSFSGYHYYCTHTPTSPSRSFSNQSDRSASSQASASSSIRSSRTVRKPRPVSIAGTLPDHIPNTSTPIADDAKRPSRSTERAASKPPRAKSAGTDKSSLSTKAPTRKASTPVKGSLKTITGSPVNTAKEPEKIIAKEEKIPAKATAVSPDKSLSPVSTPDDGSPHTPATTPALEDIPMDSSFTSKIRLTSEEEAKAALAERRRLAREQAEREAELERQRQEELKRQEEERIRLEAEEAARFEAEQLRLAEEFRRMEEEKLLKAIEENERRLKEERERLEEEQKQKEEAERKAQENAERMEQLRLQRARQEEEERLERKKRVEGIMLRIRKQDAPVPKNDISSDNISTPDEEITTDNNDKEFTIMEQSDTFTKELTPSQEMNTSVNELIIKENEENIEIAKQESPTFEQESSIFKEASIETKVNEIDSTVKSFDDLMKEESLTSVKENNIFINESIKEKANKDEDFNKLMDEDSLLFKQESNILTVEILEEKSIESNNDFVKNELALFKQGNNICTTESFIAKDNEDESNNELLREPTTARIDNKIVSDDSLISIEENESKPVNELSTPTQENIFLHESVISKEKEVESKDKFGKEPLSLLFESKNDLLFKENEIGNNYKKELTSFQDNTMLEDASTFILNENVSKKENNISPNNTLLLNEIDNMSLQDSKLIELSAADVNDVKKLKHERISPLLDEKIDISIKELNSSPNHSHLLIQEKGEIIDSQGNSTVISTTTTETVGNVTIFTTEKSVHDKCISSPYSDQDVDLWNSGSNLISTETVMSNGVDGNILNFMRDSPVFQAESSAVEQSISYENKFLHSSSLPEDLAEFDMLPTSPETQQQIESHQADFEELIDLSSFSNKNDSKHGVYVDLMNNEDDVNSNTVTSNGPTGSPLIAFDDNITKKDNISTDLL